MVGDAHPTFSPDDWKRLDELEIGNSIAVFSKKFTKGGRTERLIALNEV